jgi:hypothetical protein
VHVPVPILIFGDGASSFFVSLLENNLLEELKVAFNQIIISPVILDIDVIDGHCGTVRFLLLSQVFFRGFKISRKYNDPAIVLRVFDAIRIFPGIHHIGHG